MQADGYNYCPLIFVISFMCKIPFKKFNSAFFLLLLWFIPVFIYACSPESERSIAARKRYLPSVQKALLSAGIGKQDDFEICLLVFKQQKELEVWARKINTGRMKLIKTFNICRLSGHAGPKRKSGDLQVPEGVYIIRQFNPYSSYHLSLGLNYPNQSDKIRGDKTDPGGDIFIHGKCVTIGCLPLGDDQIEELYVLCEEAGKRGNKEIQVCIFPDRFDSVHGDLVRQYPQYVDFWEELRIGLELFRSLKRPLIVTVDNTGGYRFR